MRKENRVGPDMLRHLFLLVLSICALAISGMSVGVAVKYHLRIRNENDTVRYAYLYGMELPNPVGMGDSVAVYYKRGGKENQAFEVRCTDARVHHSMRGNFSRIDLVSRLPTAEFEEIFRDCLVDSQKID
jgi:hypothetical protein